MPHGTEQHWTIATYYSVIQCMYTYTEATVLSTTLTSCKPYVLRQKIEFRQEAKSLPKNSAPQSRSWQSSQQWFAMMLTPARGASAETPRRHPASCGFSTVTSRHAASRGPL